MTEKRNNDGRQLAKSITRHLGDKWMTWVDQPLGSVWHDQNCPRADVLAVSKSYSMVFRVYEVKITRGDFQRELMAEKYKNSLPFCHYFYFAAPKGLLKKEEIPEGCGLITFSEKGWSSIKAADKREITISQNFLLSLLMKGYQDNYERYRDLENKRLTKVWEYPGLAKAACEFGLKLANDVANSQEYLQEATELKKEIESTSKKKFETIWQAMNWLSREVHSLLNKHKYGKEAGEILELAMNLYNGYPWNIAEKLQELAERLKRFEK